MHANMYLKLSGNVTNPYHSHFENSANVLLSDDVRRYRPHACHSVDRLIDKRCDE